LISELAAPRDFLGSDSDRPRYNLRVKFPTAFIVTLPIFWNQKVGHIEPLLYTKATELYGDDLNP
jgi:hypothetical protein